MSLLDECKEKMEKTLVSVKESLSTLRAGRVSPLLLDRVMVNCYGENMNIKSVASVSAISPTDLQVKPFDPSTAKDILSGINKADLGCNAVVNGGVLLLKFPAPSEDRRQELIKQAKKYAEDGRVALRNVRKDYNNKAKKDDSLSEDMLHSLLDDIQKATDLNIKKVDELLNNKIQDIETI